MAGYGQFTGGDTQGDTDSIRFRPTNQQILLPALILAAILASQSLLLLAPHGTGLLTTLRQILIPVLAAVLVLTVALNLWVGVTLTPSAILVHSFRRRVIPLSDIRGIDIKTTLGTRTVMITEVSGRRTRLQAPVAGGLAPDRRFEEKFHTIGQWWLAHRG
ncbi:hypothetical protein [Streptomyces sp. NPDC050738]|uniref:hypothetical protein n=1 Tax=Streptomyces sp. NPDC050738 TaxID=3154744 RepID=UPI00344703BB